jgi:hypothetical protein
MLDPVYNPVNVIWVVDFRPSPAPHLIESRACELIPAPVEPKDRTAGICHPGELRNVIRKRAEELLARRERYIRLLTRHPASPLGPLRGRVDATSDMDRDRTSAFSTTADMFGGRMKDHPDIPSEAVARLHGRYADDIAAYDEIYTQILATVADLRRSSSPEPMAVWQDHQFLASPSPAWNTPMAPRPTKLNAWVTNGYSPSSAK